MKILKDDHPTLLLTCSKVDLESIPSLKPFIESMFEAMYKNNGIGLSANQVGYTFRLFVMDASAKGLQKKVLINPEIIKESGKRSNGEEGCLSYPNLKLIKNRDKMIKVSYLNENGEPKTEKFRGLDAVIVQHEIDHLNGISFKRRN